MLHRIYIGYLLLLFTLKSPAQLGGSSTYAFLNLTHSARVAALGGKASIWDDDLNLAYHNPSLLNGDMANHLVINYVNYFADINYGYVSYARDFKQIGNIGVGLHYINYGEFIAADRFGNKTGHFTASEYAFNFIWSRSLDSLFNIGVNVKPIYSVLERYRSFGLATDVGITYIGREKLFSASLVLRNIGLQIKPYYGQNREPLPFEMQLALSQKLKHAPFRFSLTAHNLQQFDLTYNGPEDLTVSIDPVTGETVQENKIEKLADNLMRHLIFGVELNPIKNLYFRAGYNYQRRRELKIETRMAMVGFSWGFGLKLSHFCLSYGRATYHLAGASNHFSLNTNISSFLRKKP